MNLGPLRRITQVIAFFLSNLGVNLALKTGNIYPFLYCYGCPLACSACPIGTLQNFVNLGICPFYLIGIMGLYGTIFGRAFCGWACPFGAFQDLLGVLGKKKRKLQPFTYSKFAMLALVIGFAWLALYSRLPVLETFFCKFCPAGSLFAALPAPFFYPEWEWGFFFNVHIITLILTILLVLLFSRFWCRYLCPLGTIGVFNRLSIVTISRDSTKCTNCLKCLDVCPMGLEKVGDIGLSSDCIMCGRCVEACTTDALNIRVRR